MRVKLDVKHLEDNRLDILCQAINQIGKHLSTGEGDNCEDVWRDFFDCYGFTWGQVDKGDLLKKLISYNIDGFVTLYTIDDQRKMRIAG